MRSWSILLAGLLSACAGTTAQAPESKPPVTVVEGSVPEPSEQERFEMMVADHVAMQKDDIEECYLSEMISGRGSGFARYEVKIGVRPGTGKPIVRILSTTDPEQRILEHCVRAALTEVEMPRRQLTPEPVKVTIAEPDWLLDDRPGTASTR